MKNQILYIVLLLFLDGITFHFSFCQDGLHINNSEYFSSDAVHVLVFNDLYFEGHQGGIGIIQHGNRVAANGDLRFTTAPGQWDAFSQLNDIIADLQNQTITVSLSFPNYEVKNRSFNPIEYSDIELEYKVRVKAEGNAFRVIVDLEKPLPNKWLGKVGFILELFPGDLFGKTFFMDETTGSFPRQLNGPFITKDSETNDGLPLATGIRLVIAPESEKHRLTIESFSGPMELLDGRSLHNNGWFIVRSPVKKGASENAIEWLITPNAIKNWKYGPVVHINQVGYLSWQHKAALIECDIRDSLAPPASLIRILPSGEEKTTLSGTTVSKGIYGQFRYYSYDFTSVIEPGIYYITCNNQRSEIFRIGEDVYDRHVWQPVLEYFLPVQMCHMRVNDRYKVWHGLCHMDDARMAPVNHTHFDGYVQEIGRAHV